MPVAHEGWLVALSALVAIQGAYVGLSLAVQTGDAIGARRRMYIAAAAVTLAVAIWAMHFVGMLAARMPFPVDYLVFPTLLSFLVCVLVVGIAVFAVTAGSLTVTRLSAAAVFMGLGIASMHYIGMTALHASAHMTHAPSYVAGSVLIAIGASGLALRLAAGPSARPLLPMSAIALGVAISGMHYTAMAGVTIYPHANAASSAPALSTDLLAIVVAVVAFFVSGLFLLILVPDRSVRWTQFEPGAGDRAKGDGDGDAEPAKAQPVRVQHLPVERDGTTLMLPIDRVVAVRANAHYSYVFDGTATYFCPLAIGDVESRLASDRFARVHRSHIVNLDRVIRLRRAGDNGRVELTAKERYSVPVSRGRLAWVKARLAPRMQQAAL